MFGFTPFSTTPFSDVPHQPRIAALAIVEADDQLTAHIGITLRPPATTGAGGGAGYTRRKRHQKKNWLTDLPLPEIWMPPEIIAKHYPNTEWAQRILARMRKARRLEALRGGRTRRKREEELLMLRRD